MNDYSWLKSEPTPLTPEEQELNRLEDEYYETFGEQFGYTICCAPPIEEAIAEIKECLKTKTKQKKQSWSLPNGTVI